jgi:hypothetical protein
MSIPFNVLLLLSLFLVFSLVLLVVVLLLFPLPLLSFPSSEVRFGSAACLPYA